MSNKETIGSTEELRVETKEVTRQEDLMRRVANAITLSDEMKEELSLDKYKAL
ncbi:hypothetical protein KA013_04250 [Patescibacteria group bacterium]|nr:hypothetical protein [Patescibacteria group bacterium]